jgi:Rps23 Pro-64 3,4-dihydroxylase Tpa1-like proline 4-hydroxylase
MKLIKLSEDIFLYEDFVTKEECKNFINLLKHMASVDKTFYRGISFYESYSSRYPDDYDPMLKQFNLSPTWFTDLEQRFKSAVSDLAQVEIEQIHKIGFHIQKWEPGAFANMHSDNSDNDGNLGAFTRSRYAGFLYANDDFEGGKLRFKETADRPELIISPKTGSFLVFHGGHKNLHEVTLVKKSSRYTVGSFWDDREEADYSEETRAGWAKELEKIRELQKEENAVWKDVRKKGLRLTPTGEKYLAKEVEEIG